jgi:hypothetical protein
MNLQQLNRRIQNEADARLGETVERLLFLLNRISDTEKLISKWRPCGLLARVPEEDMTEAAQAIELTALKLVNEGYESFTPLNEDYIVSRLKKAVFPYESDFR